MVPAKPKPATAPALVDCTKCDTPMAAPAHRSPGPKLFQKDEAEDMRGKIFSWQMAASGG